jgi:hypothetical protein
MIPFLLRVLFLTVVARLVARLLSSVAGRPPRTAGPAQRDRAPRRLAADIVDAEFEDLGEGRG